MAFSECPNFNKKVIEESPSSASARCQDIFYVATIRTLNACSLYQLVNNQNKLYYVFWQKKTKILNLPFYISSQSWKHLPGLWLINLEVKAREQEVHPSETLMLRGIHILRKHISSIFFTPYLIKNVVVKVNTNCSFLPPFKDFCPEFLVLYRV